MAGWLCIALSLGVAAGCVDSEGRSGEDRAVAVTGSAPAGEINIAGGTAHIPVMTEVQKRYAVTHPGVKIAVAGGGSGVGIKQVGEGLVDIGNSGRTPTAEEIETHGLVLHRWAVDGVAVVVHPDNPVSDLDREQLVGILAREIRDWHEAGGAAHAINV
jgi:phosphate transport system substrate-binding protein